MTTVTGITADKALEIFNASVVSGSINDEGHLILETEGGSTIDAGYVTGATGATGATGESGADASLDSIATSNPTAAAWSNAGYKIEHLGDGVASDDAASVGQTMPKTGGAFTGRVAPAVFALTFATTIAVNAALGNECNVTLTSSAGTLGSPSNPVDGQTLIVNVKQDATGGRTMAFGAAYSFSTSLPSPTLSTAANARDKLGFIYHAATSKWDFVAFVSGYAA